MESLTSNKFLIPLLCIIATSLSLNPVSGSKVCEFPAIFAFGDSNIDTGGYAATDLFPQPPPNGETFFHRPSGRYSDGRIIIDFIAQSFGLPFISGYLDSVGANFLHGANFATLGATIRVPPQVGPFYLGLQYAQFTLFKNKTQFVRQQGGIIASLMPKPEYFDKALYIFDIGQNDLSGSFFNNLTVEQVNATVPDRINAFAGNVTSVYKSGARYIWIFNTGPIGCLPYMLINFFTEKDASGCLKDRNEVAQYFNYKLKQAVAQLRKDLPLAKITLIDIYSAKYDLISNAEKYGFEKPLVACCGYGGPYNYDRDTTSQCGGTVVVNGTEILVGACKNPLVRVNWDGFHYTEAANKFLFNRISSGAFSDPPLPLNLSCQLTAY